MRCESCGRFFRPDPRVGGRQKACARAQCKQAIKKRQETAWRARSHEHLLIYEQDRRETHRDELRAYHRVYYAQNRETIRGRQIPYQRQYRRDNRLELAAKEVELNNWDVFDGSSTESRMKRPGYLIPPPKQRTRYRRDPRTYLSRTYAWKRENRQAMAWYMRQRRHLLKILPGISPEQFKTLRKKAAQL